VRRFGLVFVLFLPLVGLCQIKVPGDFPTIQEAIAHAPSGGVVLVSPGVYEETLLIEKPLTIEATKAGVVIVGGSGCRRGLPAIRIVAGPVRLIGLTVEGCPVGIEISATAELSGMRIKGNGIGIEVLGSGRVALRETTVERNTVGLEVWVGGNAVVQDGLFRGNQVGIKALRGSLLGLFDARVKENWLGIEIWEAKSVLIDGCDVSSNTDDGILVRGAALPRVSIRGCSILKNGDDGIQLGVSPMQPDRIEAEMTGNTIQGNQGCGVMVDPADVAAILVWGSGNTYANNAAGNLFPQNYPWPKGF